MEVQRESVFQTTVTKEKRYKTKYFASIVFGFVLAVVAISAVVSGYINIVDKFGPKYDFVRITTYLAYFIAISVSTMFVAKILRTNSPQMQQWGINIPNPFYSEYAVMRGKVGDVELLKENQKLNVKLQENEKKIELHKKLILQAAQDMQAKDKLATELQKLNTIFTRNNKNASRLVRSLYTLLGENKENWKKEFMDNVLKECVTTLFSDKANKSSSLFLVNEYDELEIFAYNRIDTQSAREKNFKMGEGLAGEVWEKGETMKIDDVSQNSGWSDKKLHLDHYLSIIGTPVRVDNEIVGVLCIQSEEKKGFEKDDEVMIRFYADICGLAEYCDMIMKNKEGEE